MAAKEAAKEAAEQLAEAQHLRVRLSAHKKALIAAYQQEQQEAAREGGADHARGRRRSRMAKRLAQAEYNLKRVQYRIELDERKKEMMREQKRALRLLGEEKMMRLERVRRRLSSG